MITNMPYFDLIFEGLDRSDKDFKDAFGEYIHWGVWKKNQHVTPKEYNVAQNRLSQIFFNKINLKNSQKILDVGCGNGGAINLINKTLKNSELIGINIDERQLNYAMKRLVSQNKNKIILKKMDASKMNFDVNSFDIIYALESIFHLPDRERFIKDVKTILKPGGTFAFTDFVPIFPFNFIFSFIEKLFHIAKKTYGPVNSNISMKKYFNIFKENHFEVKTILDITKETLLTYDCLEKHLTKLDDVNYKNFKRANRIMRIISKLKLLRYKIIVLENGK